MRLQELTRWHRRSAVRFLEADPMANLFQLGELERHGIISSELNGWNGVFEREQLIAVSCSFGRVEKGLPTKLIVAYGDMDASVLLGEHERQLGGAEFIVGPRSGSDGVIIGLQQGAARLHFNQRLYVCTTADVAPYPSTLLEFRPAVHKELDTIKQMSAEMMLEDLGFDPREKPENWHQTVERRIKERRCLIGLNGNQIVFVLDIGTMSGRGCQVGGTYVPPEFRGQGISSIGMTILTHKLLNRFPAVTLHVNEANTPAVRCYERSGFQRAAPFRFTIYDVP